MSLYTVDLIFYSFVRKEKGCFLFKDTEDMKEIVETKLHVIACVVHEAFDVLSG